MLRNFYFTICAHPAHDGPKILRLVVVRSNLDDPLDHYYEYGASIPGRLTLGNSLWSTDAEALIGHLPQTEQFHACMDLRLFLRTDLDDALDGSLMTDDFEIIVREEAMRALPA